MPRPGIDVLLLNALVLFVGWLGLAAYGLEPRVIATTAGGYVLGAVTHHVATRGRRL
jgi:hypothetical protein